MNSLSRFTSSVSPSIPVVRRPWRTRSAKAAAFALTVAAGLGLGALSGPVGSSLPAATAAPDPCAASQVAETVAMVATHTGNYLEANPEADQTITAISKQQGGPESIAALKAYFDANPKLAADMQRLQQPLVSLSAKCGLPLTLPQVFGLMQAAQQPPATPAAPNAGAQ
jgi:hemophore